MGNCECSCVYVPDGDRSDFSYVEIRKARKNHKCYECGDEIKPGDRYEHASGKWDGEVDTFKTCLDCVSIRDVFCCQWLYGDVRSSVNDMVRECGGIGMPWDKMSELTPSASEWIFGLIEDVWEQEGDDK